MMAEPLPTPDVYATALEALAAGLCPIPARTDGSKAPRGTWERWQTERPTIEQLQHWFADGHPGIGIVCGEISGNLEMLELEGVAVAGGVGREVTRLAKAAGIGDIIERLRHGYTEKTPSNGIHWLYRVDGDPVPGNTKLARRLSSEAELAQNPDDKIKTLIETRGEGGFTIIAPSHGTTHPTGKPWYMKEATSIATIPTITSAERDALHAICRQLDAYTAEKIHVAPIAPASRIKAQRFTGQVGESWVDTVCGHLAATETWDTILSRYGWRYLRQDRHGSDLWCRPGKDDGVGAWVKNDRLNVFSSSTPLDSADRTTHDRLEVVAAYEHRGDRQAAARAVSESTGILDAWKADRDATGNTAPPAGNVDAGTGEIGQTDAAHLPVEFWDSRPILTHIRQAAHSRLVSADAVLLGVLARAVMLAPPKITLPAIVGGRVSLNLFCAIVDPSGGGKSAAVSVARQLLPTKREDIIDPILPSSGEGLIEAFFEFVMEEQSDGKKRKVKRQTKLAGFAFVDEGQSLLSQADRSGSTIMETIRSAWMGGDLGQHNAAEERKRWLKPHTYRLSMLVGFQLHFAAGLIADGEGGTPQRFTFALATDPTLDGDAQWPGEIHLDPIPLGGEIDIGFPSEVVAAIRTRRAMRSQGTLIVDPLDTHADLRRMKLAAALALLDNRMDANVEDWELAGIIDATSCAVRTRAIEHAAITQRHARNAATSIAVERDAIVESAAIQRTLNRVARNMARAVWRGGAMTPASAYRVVSSRDRGVATMVDIVAVCVDQSWLIDGGEMLSRGSVAP